MTPETSESSSEHIHAYELHGSRTYWAECACGDKLRGERGPIVGGRAKVQAAIKAWRA